MLTLLLVALGLGLDNFAASVGIGISGVSGRTRLRVAVIFGLFEAAMPVLGVLLGHSLAADLGPATRWLGAALLIATGCYALLQAVRSRGPGKHPAGPAPGPGPGEHPAPASPPVGQSAGRLLVTGAALSVDNLAVGFALGTTHVGLAVTAVVIGVISVALSVAGLELGSRLGAMAGEYGEVAGGLVLVGVGVAVACGAR